LVCAEYALGKWQIKVLFLELKNHLGKMTDPITDMLNRIVNAQAVFHPTVDVPFSNFKYEIVKILEQNGFVKKIEKKGRKTSKILIITLKYENNEDKKPIINGFKKVSKPGQKIYSSWKEIKRVKSGFGIGVVSTSKGLMSDKEARKNKLGGEILFEIW